MLILHSHQPERECLLNLCPGCLIRLILVPALLFRPLLVRTQEADTEPPSYHHSLPCQQAGGPRRPSKGSVGLSLAELAQMLFTQRRLRTPDYERLKGLSSGSITSQ